MKSHDPLEQWLSERRAGAPAPGFADRVMARVRAAQAPETKGGRDGAWTVEKGAARRLRALAIAAAACAALLWHMTLVGVLVLAMSGAAQ